jgi:hypothetical protein
MRAFLLGLPGRSGAIGVPQRASGASREAALLPDAHPLDYVEAAQ